MHPVRHAGALALVTLAVIAMISLTACGDDDDDTAGDPTASPAVTGAPPGILAQPAPPQELSATVTEAQDGVLEVAAQDTRFVENNFHIPAEQPVTIRVTNGDSVRHNLRVAGPDGVFETEDDAATNPEAIAGGATGELTFAPAAQGAYTFRCDFHPTSMGGSILVGQAGTEPTPTPFRSDAPTATPLASGAGSPGT